MIEVTAVQFVQNPSHIQALAEKEPVLVADGDKKQVLINYEEYQKHMGEKLDKPFVSLAQMIGYTPAADVEFDEEADFSFAEQSLCTY